jgi:hypothetical protein
MGVLGERMQSWIAERRVETPNLFPSAVDVF